MNRNSASRVDNIGGGVEEKESAAKVDNFGLKEPSVPKFGGATQPKEAVVDNFGGGSEEEEEEGVDNFGGASENKAQTVDNCEQPKIGGGMETMSSDYTIPSQLQVPGCSSSGSVPTVEVW